MAVAILPSKVNVFAQGPTSQIDSKQRAAAREFFSPKLRRLLLNVTENPALIRPLSPSRRKFDTLIIAKVNSEA